MGKRPIHEQTSTMNAKATAYTAGVPADGSQREAWLDIAKGIGIVLVVFGHVTNGLVAARIVPATNALTYVYYVIYTFHMPLFFFLSGITVPLSLQGGTPVFLRRKLATVAYPYFVWSIIQGLVQLTASNSLNSPFKLEYLFLIPISPLGHFWFLYVLMAFHVLAAVSGGRSHWLVVGAALSLSFYAFTEGLPRLTFYHMPFYVAGFLCCSLLVSHRVHAFLVRCGRLGAVTMLAFFIGGASASAALTHGNYTNPIVVPVAAVGILSTVMVSYQLVGLPLSRPLQHLGRLSLSIYVMHVMAAAGTRIVLSELGLIQSPLAVLVLCTLAGLLLPLTAHQLLAHVGLLELFGLRSWRPAEAAVAGSVGSQIELRRSAGEG
jgi:fucose 4-O-acetylase-like acetyltransferase